jgi:hypothetical protein
MAWPPHITVATIVKDQDRYLMVEEIIDRQAVLNQPAGHLEPGESLFDAAPGTAMYCRLGTPARSATGFHQPSVSSCRYPNRRHANMDVRGILT